MTQLRRMLLLLHVPLLTVWFTMACAAYDTLPQRFPVHFNVAGVPDGYADRSFISWFTLPLVALGVILLMIASNWLTERYPGLLNVPEKETYMSLSPSDRAPLNEMVRLFTGVISLAVTVLLGTLHFDSWLVATGRESSLSYITTATVILFVTVVIGGATWFMAGFSRRAKELAVRASRHP